MRTRLFILFFSACLTQPVFSAGNPDSLLKVLDKTIETHAVYTREKELRINRLRSQLTEKESPTDIYELNLMLFQEFKSYKCDSAIACLNKNIRISDEMGDSYKTSESKLLLSHLLASSGIYLEAVDIINTIDRKHLPPELLLDYYICNNHIYEEASLHTQDPNSSVRYRNLGEAYKDSIYNVISEDSELYIRMRETHFRDMGETGKAIELNDLLLKNTQPGTPAHALITYYRALDYQRKGDRESEKYYLALSSLSDIQSATKDHASLWMLAQILHEEGDIERAYRYIRFSWDETVFYNARLRSSQTAGILSLIDETYHALMEKKNQLLRRYTILISVLVIMLAVACVFIYRQMKKLSVARNNLQDVNAQLKTLNEELQQMNICLRTTNVDLLESNHIKEEYIGRFIKLCSTYIDKLNGYRRMVYKKIAHGQIDEVLTMTRSPEALDSELNELYANFDRAFLQIFPDFVGKFNELLMENESIIPKKGELLNTELRIFALIRLGINDSQQIAEFLRYSVNTIYNYRAKVKNKTRVSREDFENRVRMIR